jgi:hypothetical protein
MSPIELDSSNKGSPIRIEKESPILLNSATSHKSDKSCMIIDSSVTKISSVKKPEKSASSVSPWIDQKVQQQQEARAEEMDPLKLFQMTYPDQVAVRDEKKNSSNQRNIEMRNESIEKENNDLQRFTKGMSFGNSLM